MPLMLAPAPPLLPPWLLFAAGALSYGVGCLWQHRHRRTAKDDAAEDADAKRQQQQQRKRRRRRRARGAANAAVAAAAATAVAVTTSTRRHANSSADDDHDGEEEGRQPRQNLLYRPLGERVAACQARWVLEELEAAAAQDEGLMGAASAGRHAARAAEMLAAGYGSRLGAEAAARWAHAAWALQTLRRPARADAAALGGSGRRGRGGENDGSDATDDAVASSGSDGGSSRGEEGPCGPVT